MDANKRFDQLESILVDLARKQEQQSAAIARQEQRLDRIEQRLDDIGEQIGDIINILKMSADRHIETERRQDAMLAEIREQGQEIKEQGRRLDSAMQVQLQMLQLMRAGNDKTDDLARRLPAVEGQEPRIKRLEDEVFRQAS